MSLIESCTRFFGWWLINVDMLLILLLTLGGLAFFFSYAKWGKRLILMASFGFLFFAIVPVGLWTIENLENRFPRPDVIPADVVGIIFLGGNFDLASSAGRGEASYNLAAGRMLSFIKLARANPHLKLAFTGGGYKIPFYGNRLSLTEAALTKQGLEALGFDTMSMVFEDKSRNTIENASFLKDLVKPKPGEKWLLLTSAFHMPRSVGLFEKAGWTVVPYPVDYHTPGHYEMWFFVGLREGLLAFSHGIREWVSMTQNYLYGRSNSLYPGPQS